MTKKPFVVEEDKSVGAALSLFKEQGISPHLLLATEKIASKLGNPCLLPIHFHTQTLEGNN